MVKRPTNARHHGAFAIILMGQGLQGLAACDGRPGCFPYRVPEAGVPDRGWWRPCCGLRRARPEAALRAVVLTPTSESMAWSECCRVPPAHLSRLDEVGVHTAHTKPIRMCLHTYC